MMMNEIKPADLTPAATSQEAVVSESPWRILVRRYFRSRVGAIAILLLAILIVAAIAAPLIAPQDPYDLAKVSILEAERSPGTMSTDQSMQYLLGPALGHRSMPHLERARWLGGLALVIDCHTRELLGWHLSRSGKSKTAQSALEQALNARHGSLGRVTAPFLLRSDNGLVFTRRSYSAVVRSYGLQQEFITSHWPRQNDVGEGVIRTLKEQCASRHRFEPLQHASRIIGDWLGFYNHRRPHQMLGMKSPAEAFALAAKSEQVSLGHYIDWFVGIHNFT